MEEETRLLEDAFSLACEEVGIQPQDKAVVCSLLAPLRDKSHVTHLHYRHSLRVALLARAIARFAHHEEKPLVFAGALHDIGKAQMPLEILGKQGTWTDADQRAISRHVLDGYRMLRGRFDFSAQIMLWHHQFQERGYPSVMPAPLYRYSKPTKLLIVTYGRLLALADVYDALHRPNSKWKEGGELSAAQVKEKMLQFNPDLRKFVLALYDARVFVH